MKHETAVALILEARRQGHAEAQTVFEVAMKSVAAAVPSVEALQAEVERLKALLKAARQKRIDRVKLTAELWKGKEEECRLAELGRLVEAMPNGYYLSHSGENWCAGVPFVDDRPSGTADNPADALRAAGRRAGG